MFSYPEEDRMEKNTSLAIKGRKSERCAGKKEEEGGKIESFNLCDQRILLHIPGIVFLC